MAAVNITYYVRKSGDESNDGLTKETAFLTIQRTIDISNGLSSDSVVTVYIGAGDYTGDSRIVLTDTGNLEDVDFNFIGDIHGWATGDSGVVEVHSLYMEVSDGQRDVLFKNIKWTHAFMNAFPHASTVFYYHDGSDSSISHLTFDGCTFETPVEQGSGYAGAVVFDWGGTGTVKNCLFDTRGGVRFNGDAQKHGNKYCIGTFRRPGEDVTLNFYHNTFFMTDHPGSVINHFYASTTGGFDFEFLNNLIVDAQSCMVYCGEDDQSAVAVSGENNYFDRTGTPAAYPFYDIADQYLTITDARVAEKETQSLHIGVDEEASPGPGVVPGTRYELEEDSPCIDLGMEIGVTEDIILSSRPYGAAPDTGCYELVRYFVLTVSNAGDVSITRSKFQFRKYPVTDAKRRSIWIESASSFFIAMNICNLNMVFPDEDVTKHPSWNVIADGYQWN